MFGNILRSSASAMLLLACGEPLLGAPMPPPSGTSGPPPAAVAGSPADPLRGAAGAAANPLVPGGGTLAPRAGSPALGPTAPSGPLAMPPGGSSDDGPVGPAGFSMDSASGELVFRTEPVELDSGQESYTCFAATLEQDVVVDGFRKSPQSFVHHEQLVIAFLPELEGTSECPQQFSPTWLPIFLAGAGESELELDEGVGHALAAGTQLVLQMHLLNGSEKTLKQAVEVRMTLSSSPNPTPVVPWAIGSADIRIPPGQTGKAQMTCTQTGPAKVLAVFPHMHTLGRRMTIEVGPSESALQPLYVRDPFDFDDQRMEKVNIALAGGELLRVTCDYQNTTQSEVGFGESTHDEMCFFVGFALGDDSFSPADCPGLWENLLFL